MLLADLSGLGPLLELISRSDVEDVALNLGHIYVVYHDRGWETSVALLGYWRRNSSIDRSRWPNCSNA